MCTFLILNQVRRDYPLIIAANRDEYYSRRGSAPRLLWHQPRILGSLDERSGGTWLGATSSGFFVGITNQRTGNPSFQTPRSRGQLVLECLKDNSPQKTCDRLRRMNGADYNPCNLLFGTAKELWIAYLRPDRAIEIRLVKPGVHVLPNDRLNTTQFQKVARARRLLDGHLELGWPDLLSALLRTLADHRRPLLHNVPPRAPRTLMPRLLARHLDSLCIHSLVYGTCSSAVIALEEEKLGQYVATVGAPCRSPVIDVAEALLHRESPSKVRAGYP